MKKLFAIFATVVLAVVLIACQKTDDEIKVYSRDTTSGTREAFFGGIGFSAANADDSVLVSSVIIVDGNGAMINSVSQDENGVGYISLSSLAGTSLVGLNFNGVEATEANVLNDTYGLKRPFNYIIRATYANAENDAERLAAAFAAFLTTVEGKATIKARGGILETSSSDPTWDSIKEDYPVTAQNNSGVTVIFGGSTSVESIARALSQQFASLAGNFVPEHNHTGSGAAYNGTQGNAADGANAMHIGFASRPFSSSENGAAGTFGRLSWDAVVAVVHANNSLRNITAEQLAQIYRGDVTSWKDLA